MNHPRPSLCAPLLVVVALLQGCPTPDPEPDAGATDGGVADAGSEGDAGAPDGGDGDGGTGDGGTGDSGTDDGGAGDGGSDGGAPDPIALDDFCDALHEVICAGFESCGCSLEGRSFTLETCVEVRAAACEEDYAGPRAAVEAGAVEFDEERAAACVAEVRALGDGCRRIGDETMPLDCALLFVSVADLGAACEDVPEGLLCAGGAGVCAPGESGLSCVELPGEGESCGGLCADGLVCDPGLGTCRAPLALGDACQGGGCPDGSICHDGTCRAPLAEDEGPCRASFECAAGLTCNNEGTCVPGPARGEACDGPMCGSGDACVRAYEERTCASKVADGEACTDHPDCASGFCAASVGVCAPLPGEGDPCPDVTCAAGLTCDFEQGLVCVAPPGENEACLPGSSACAEGLGCNDQNVCVAPPGVGEACLIPDNLCATGLGCDFTPEGSFCIERRGEGEDCQSDVCQDGLFCDFTTATCEPLLDVGEACPTGGGCAEGDECGDLLGGFRCHDVPETAGAPCYERCAGDLACLGEGGVCAPELCASP